MNIFNNFIITEFISLNRFSFSFVQNFFVKFYHSIFFNNRTSQHSFEKIFINTITIFFMYSFHLVHACPKNSFFSVIFPTFLPFIIFLNDDFGESGVFDFFLSVRFAFSKRKLCNGENFRIKDFDEFRCFSGS